MTDRRPTVLVVDDDPDVLMTLRLALEHHCYEVTVASSAEEGLRHYKESRPDAVVVDLMMEEVDSGIRFVRELRFSGNTPPIFMLSSVGDSLHTTVQYEDLGLSGVFQKPVDPATLIGMLAARLSEDD